MRNLFRRIYRFLLPRLFARHDFKLMLTASLGVLGERARLLTAATDYFQGVVRSIPITARLWRVDDRCRPASGR